MSNKYPRHSSHTKKQHVLVAVAAAPQTKPGLSGNMQGWKEQLTPFCTASTTSLAVAVPTPTRPFSSPMTTTALHQHITIKEGEKVMRDQLECCGNNRADIITVDAVSSHHSPACRASQGSLKTCVTCDRNLKFEGCCITGLVPSLAMPPMPGEVQGVNPACCSPEAHGLAPFTTFVTLGHLDHPLLQMKTTYQNEEQP